MIIKSKENFIDYIHLIRFFKYFRRLPLIQSLVLMIKNKISFCLGITALLGIPLFSCSDNSEMNQANFDLDKTFDLTVADANQPVFALIYIAEQQGYFSDVGLNITYLNYTSGRDALQSLIANKSDLALVYETPVVHQAFNQKPIKILTSLHSSELNTSLVVRRDHGIQTINDLIGKNIGVPKKTNAEFFLHTLLQSHNINIEQVNVIDIKPQDSAKLIKEGGVDAVAAWNPHLYDAKKQFPATQVHTYHSALYSEMSMLVTLQDRINHNRERFVRFISAMKKAKLFKQEHPQESLALIVRHLKNSYDKKSIEDTWNDFYTEMTLSNRLLGLLTLEARWLKEQKITNAELPNFIDYIDSSILAEVDQGAVTIVVSSK